MGFLSDVGQAFSDATSWSSLFSDVFGTGGSKPNIPNLPSNLFGPQGANAQTDGISSTMQGPNPPAAAAFSNTSSIGSQVGKGLSSAAHGVAGALGKFGSDALSSMGQEGISSAMQSMFHRGDAAKQGKATRDYLAAAFPELTPWERAGAGGSMSGVQDAGFAQTTKQTQMNNDTQVKLAQIQSNTAKSIAGINAVTSRMNTSDQVFAQNSKLVYEQKQLEAATNKIITDTDLSTQQKAESIARTYTQYLQAQGVQLTNEQIPAITANIKAQIDNTKQNTLNAKGSQSQVGKTVSDAGVMLDDFWHYTKRNYDSFLKAGGIRSTLSRK